MKARGRTNRQEKKPPARRAAGRWLLPVLLGLYVVLSIVLFDPKLATFGDNAHYLILGKSLAAGKGYRDLNLPDAPVQTQYPPGFPLMLAGITLLFGGVNVLAAKLFVLLTGVGAMFFIYRLCVLLFRDEAWPVMLVFAALPALVENNHWILTEIPFLLVLMAALYCLAVADQRAGTTAAWLRIGASGLAVAACFIRTAGIVLVLGMVLNFAVRRQYRDLVVLVLLWAATIIPWQILNTRAGHGQPYFEQLLAKHPYFLERGRATLGDWGLRVWQNLRDYVSKGIPRLVFPVGRGSWFETLTGIILFLLAAIGFVRGLGQLAGRAPARQFAPIAACALFAGPLLLGWPSIWSSERFLLPFLPLVIIFLFHGLQWLSAKLKARALVPVFVTALVIANAVQVYSLAGKALRENIGYLQGDRYSGYPIDWRRYFETIEWISTNTPEDAVVLARKPEFVYVLSGRRSYCYPMTTDGGPLMAALLGSTHVLIDNFQWTDVTAGLLGPVLKDNPDLWELAFTTPHPEFYVLRIKPGVPRQPPAPGPEDLPPARP
jgi:hypothetical protein